MEGHHDLQEFISETVVAQSCDVLSSGREAGRRNPWGRAVDKVSAGTDRRIDNVKRLTPGVRIESLMLSGSDQKAAEALQEAETEVGVGDG
jgi:hypothetical protein